MQSKIAEELKADNEVLLTHFLNAVNRLLMDVEMRSMKFGGAVDCVPIPSSELRQKSRALRLFVYCVRKLYRSEVISMSDALAKEIRKIMANIGENRRVKGSTRKTTAANNAFTHIFKRRGKAK